MDNNYSLTIPGFGSSPAITLELSKTKIAEDKMHLCQNVNPAIYNDLEYTMQESYRELKKVMSKIGYEITKAEKALKLAKSEAVLDKYPEFLVEHLKKFPEGKKAKDIDNAHTRDAFISRDSTVLVAQDRIDMLKALEALYDGKIKSTEKICGFMRTEMQLCIRAGVIR